MTLIEEKTLHDHDINVKSIRQELQIMEEQLKKHGRNELQPSPTVTADPDTVSRQAVLDAVNALTKWSLLDRNGCHVGVGMKYRDVKETVKNLPPSPSRPQGHWIRHHEITDGNDIIKGYMCNQCKRVVEVHSWETLNEKYPFCNCGADMRQNGGVV